MKLSDSQKAIFEMMQRGYTLISTISENSKTQTAWMQQGEPGGGGKVRKASFCTVKGMFKKQLIAEDYRTLTMVIYKAGINKKSI